MIIMFNKNCTLRELPISERVLKQVDYDNDELIIVVYLLLNYYSSIFNTNKSKTMFASCELILAYITGEIESSRRARTKMVNSLKSLNEKGLVKIIGGSSVAWDTLLKLDIKQLLPKENETLHTIDLKDYFKLCQLNRNEFITCLQLYILIKSHIDNDDRFLNCATMISQTRITLTRFWGDMEKKEWITKSTYRKYMSLLCELGIFSKIDATPSDLSFNLPYIYCRQDDSEVIVELIEEVIESLEIVKQTRDNEGKNNKSSWSWKVRERDNHKCVICGKTEGVMHAHHLNAKTLFPKQSLDVNNGVTLCQNCHIDFHTSYGAGSNTKEQFEEFKKVRTP